MVAEPIPSSMEVIIENLGFASSLRQKRSSNPVMDLYVKVSQEIPSLALAYKPLVMSSTFRYPDGLTGLPVALLFIMRV